jgi:hypothetical protein
MAGITSTKIQIDWHVPVWFSTVSSSRSKPVTGALGCHDHGIHQWFHQRVGPVAMTSLIEATASQVPRGVGTSL